MTGKGAFHGDYDLLLMLLQSIKDFKKSDYLGVIDFDNDLHHHAHRRVATEFQFEVLKRHGYQGEQSTKTLAEALGLPHWLIYLEDHLLFPYRNNSLRRLFSITAAINPGADLSKVVHLWLVRLLNRRIAGAADPQGNMARVRDLFLRASVGDDPTEEEWITSAVEPSGRDWTEEEINSWTVSSWSSEAGMQPHAAAWAGMTAIKADALSDDHAWERSGLECYRQTEDLIEILKEAI